MIEKEIKSCLLELVKLEQPEIGGGVNQSTESLASAKHSQKSAGITIYVPIVRLQQNHPLFVKMSVEAIRCLLQIGNFITLLPNQILYKEGAQQQQRSKKFYIILYGLLGYQSSERGGTYVTFGIGATVGEEWIHQPQH